MRKNLLFLLIIILLGIVIFFWQFNRIQTTNVDKKTLNTVQEKKSFMKLTSDAFSDNQAIPKKYSCDGESVNPSLNIFGVPGRAKSLSIIVDDPDAPMGTFVHWVVFNIKPEIAKIGENSVPEGAIEGITSAGRPGFIGPCPPMGTHHYHFKLYALDTVISLSSSAKKQDLEKAMTGHLIDEAELIGLYSRGSNTL